MLHAVDTSAIELFIHTPPHFVVAQEHCATTNLV